MPDTGPPFPPPVPGSNQIGEFKVGVSPIGTIPPFDVWATIIMQYSNSPILDAIIVDFDGAMDLTGLVDNFYDLVMNVQTAQGEGLDVWGRIVGASRTLLLPGSAQYLGFEEAGSWVGFNQSPFYSGGQVTQNFNLSDAQFRQLIYAKALSNISDGGMKSANEILMTLFQGRGNAWVIDDGGMEVTYAFNFQLTSVEVAMLAQSGILPTSAGVLANIVQVPSFLGPFIIGGGGLPEIFADLAENNYWANVQTYTTFANWLSGLGTSFTRGSSATFVNSSGLLASASTNVARFDYDPISLNAIGLLMEGASTNWLLQSNAFTTTWTTSGAPTLAQNVTGPDGVANSAWTLTAAGAGFAAVLQSVSLSGTTWNLSIFGKAGTDNWAYLGINDAGGGLAASFNVSSGAVGTVGWNTSGAPTGAMSNARIKTYANGFFRISVTWTGSIPTAAGFGVADADASATVTNGKTAVFFGAQMEPLPFASSYIPTTTGTVTRSKDVFAAIAVPASPVATLFAEADVELATYSAQQILLSLNDGVSGNTRTDLYVNAVGQAAADAWVSSSQTMQMNSTTSASSDAAFGAAATYTPGFGTVSLNGGPAGLSSTGTPGSNTNLSLGGITSSETVEIYGHLRQIGYWALPATTAQVEALAAQ